MRHVVKKLTAQQLTLAHIHRCDAQTPLCRVQINWELGKIRGYFGSPGAQSTLPQDTDDRRYIVQEAQTLFRQNQQLTDQESIKKCLAECEARIEIDLPAYNGTGNPERQEAESTATHEEAGQASLLSHMRTADTTADTR
ncbi:LOW QUALITY PROTEIN: LYR motif containing protein 1 [Salvelinus alpinus]